MVYEWGTKPNVNYTEYSVESNYKFAKGEYGRLENGALAGTDVCREDRIPSEQTIAENFVNLMKSKGADVVYLKLHRETEFAYSGGLEHSFAFYYVKAYVEECIFKGDIFVADDVLIAMLIIAIAGGLFFYFMWAYSPIIYKWADVTPKEVGEYQATQATPMILFIILVIAIAFVIVAWKGKAKVTVKR